MLFAALLSTRDVWLWGAFAFYVVVIIVYSAIYHRIYLWDRSHYSFGRDIRDTRTKSFKSEASATLQKHKRVSATLSDLIKHLDRSQPEVRWKDEGRKECVQILRLKSGDSVELDCSLQERTLDAAAFGEMTKTVISEVVYRLALSDSLGDRFFDSEVERYRLKRDVSISAYGPGYSKNLGSEPDPSSLIPAGRDVLEGLANELISALNIQDTVLNGRLATANDEFPHVWGFIDFLYFSTITQATVGYGDILPNSSLVRMIVMSQIGLGYFVLVVVINMILAG